MYNFVQKYFAQIVHFCIDNNILQGFSRVPLEFNSKYFSLKPL